MSMRWAWLLLVLLAAPIWGASLAHASLSLTAGNNATTTPNVATSITGFQIVGNAASTTPVKLRATSGTLSLSAVTGVTMTGNNSSTVSLSGTVEKLNLALATLTYNRASTGTDTLEVSLVEATEVFFEDNGHLYKYISDAGTWNAAKPKAEALTLYGATGYLATISSAEENAFVTARLSNAGWMGASDSAVEGAWRWVTGPENGTQFWSGASVGSTVDDRYANWGTGEPNNSGDEDCAQYLTGGTGKWNDLPCGSTSLPGYVAEFGAPGALPTVVAQNISIVTADVPAISTLFPANGALTATSSASLVIRFTKTVTPQTGNITIYDASDDSIFETIDVISDAVSGGGTGAITINPEGTFEEGATYYVTIPSTAFRDGSSNYFDGFSGEDTWSFTIVDVTPPSFSSFATSTATTTATITWNTNENASTRLWYSVDSSHASSTNETNTSSRVQSHSVSLTNLRACTSYSYLAVARDAALNAATSTAGSFLTGGCVGTPLETETAAVVVSAPATTTLTEQGRTFRVETPADFTATSSTVVIQIKSIESAGVLNSIGIPNSLNSAASIVFDVTALIDNVTELDSFDAPVTITYEYTDEDIVGLNESSLWLYHHKAGVWSALDACTLNLAENRITCQAPHFSIFGVFGSLTPEETGTRSSARGGSITQRVQSLHSLGMHTEADSLASAWPNLFPQTQQSSSMTLTVRDLELGMTGSDVLQLQKLLNTNGFQLATEGAGAPGFETEYFGTRTKDAVSAYQRAHGVSPAVGYFGPLTRASMKTVGVSGMWW